MFSNLFYRFFLFVSINTSLYAGSMGHLPKNFFLSYSGGPSWTNTNQTQFISLQPDIISAYVPQNLNNSNLLGNGEIYAGIQNSFFSQLQSQFGLAVYLSSYSKINGYIQEDGDPNFQNYSYQYKINHGHIALKSKWILENDFNMNPYVSGSIGVGLNRSYDYLSTPIIYQEVLIPMFQSNTQVTVSYLLGTGFQRVLNDQWSYAVGYQFAAWGPNCLGKAPGQTSGTGLGLGNLYTHGVELNITYFI